MEQPGDWDVSALLCDFAQVADGKLYLLGGGWSLTGPGAFLHALAIKLAVPWEQSNKRHVLSAVLLTEDGNQVELGDPAGPVRFQSEFEVGRPAGLPPGTQLDVPLAVNLGPMELEPNAGYVWSLSIDGIERRRVPFRTRPAR